MIGFSETIITKLRIEGFRSLEKINLNLENVTVLAGPNSSGKSSILDALSFLKEAVIFSPDEAFRNRGGVESVRMKTGLRSNTLAIEIQFKSRTPGAFQGFYYVLFQFTSRNDFSITEETCQVDFVDYDQDETSYKTEKYTVEKGKWKESVGALQPSLTQNRLALPLLSGIRAFAPIYQAVTSFRSYSIHPESLRALQDPDDDKFLQMDGSNAVNILKNLQSEDKSLFQVVLQTLAQLVPSIKNIRPKRRGSQWTIAFEEEFFGQQPVEFESNSMSDGTLRILAMLLAIYQPDPPALIGIEDPEAAIHPGAAAVLVDAFNEAALRNQILITTHSPDLLTRFEVNSVRAVDRVEGVTRVNVISEAQRDAVQERLFTLGELHRIEGLQPDISDSKGAEEDA
jgi:predicted ATPase